MYYGIAVSRHKVHMFLAKCMHVIHSGGFRFNGGFGYTCPNHLAQIEYFITYKKWVQRERYSSKGHLPEWID